MAVSDAIAAGAPVGRYEIVSLLSAGGMGELYRARDPELGRDLVLKLLPRGGVFHPDALERFVRKAFSFGNSTRPQPEPCSVSFWRRTTGTVRVVGLVESARPSPSP